MLEIIIGRHTWNCQIRTHIHTKIHTHTQTHTQKRKSRKSRKVKKENEVKSIVPRPPFSHFLLFFHFSFSFLFFFFSFLSFFPDPPSFFLFLFYFLLFLLFLFLTTSQVGSCGPTWSGALQTPRTDRMDGSDTGHSHYAFSHIVIIRITKDFSLCVRACMCA